MFVAIYVPSDGPKDRPKAIAGFRTEECAWDHVYHSMCKGCKDEREAALNGDEEWGEEIEFPDGTKTRMGPSKHPGCACEWEVYDETQFSIEELESIYAFQISVENNETDHKTSR